MTPNITPEALDAACLAYYEAGGDTLVHTNRIRAALEAALPELLAAQPTPDLDYTPGELDRTAPARIWLQIDTTGDNSDRSDAWAGSEGVTWQDEQIGGLEIQYMRADLAAQPASSAGGQVVAGRVSGYLPDARAVEVVLDAAVPEWITKLPDNVRLSAAPVAGEAAQVKQQGGSIIGWKVIDGVTVFDVASHSGIVEPQQFVSYVAYLSACATLSSCQSAAPPAPAAVPAAQGPLHGKYGDVLRPFVAMMERELHANAGKGDRPAWLAMDCNTALLEIFYHLSKLQKAVRSDNGAGICEYAADVANMSMMLVDICGGIAVIEDLAQPAAPQGVDLGQLRQLRDKFLSWSNSCSASDNAAAAFEQAAETLGELIDSQQQQQGDDRPCYACGERADSHPWETQPGGGKKRGACPAAQHQQKESGA